MAPQVGLEPTTDRLTADSSTTELLRNITNSYKLPLDSYYYKKVNLGCQGVQIIYLSVRTN